VIRAAALLLAAITVMTLDWFATGPTFGLFIAGLFVLAIIPPMLRRITDASAIVGGIAIVWLFACFNGRISVGQWVQCTVTLLAFGTFLLGLTILLTKFRVHAIAASAITVAFATLWLTWPIWLSPTLRDHSTARVVHWLVQLSPLLAINGILLHLGPWTQEPMAYHLTDLGQNVVYSLPANAIATTAMHALLGAALIALGTRRQRALP
jgi:hypothetical protein